MTLLVLSGILGAMIQKTQTTFIVDGGMWRISIDALNPHEAAAQAFHDRYQQDGDKIQVAPYIEVLDIDKLQLTQDENKSISWLYTPLVMADAGYHGLSSSFYSLLEDLSE